MQDSKGIRRLVLKSLEGALCIIPTPTNSNFYKSLRDPPEIGKAVESW